MVRFMGWVDSLKEAYYAWRQGNLQEREARLIEMHERCKSEIEKCEDKIRKIRESGYGRKSLPKPSEVLRNDDRNNKERWKNKEPFERPPEVIEMPLPTHTLMRVSAEKVIDPFSCAAPGEKIDLLEMNASAYTRVDTRNPLEVIDVSGNMLARNKGSFSPEVYTYISREVSSGVRAMSDMEKHSFEKYSLAYSAVNYLVKPLEYLAVERGNGSKFYIAEMIQRDSVGSKHGLHEYSIKRYNEKLGCFVEDIIFSEGIDLARMMAGDKEYINAVGNRLLSEERLDRCLQSPGEVREVEQREAIMHGAGYVGYLDAKTLEKNSRYRDFETLQKEREEYGYTRREHSKFCREQDALKRMFPEKYTIRNRKNNSLDRGQEKRERM